MIKGEFRAILQKQVGDFCAFLGFCLGGLKISRNEKKQLFVKYKIPCLESTKIKGWRVWYKNI